MVDSAHSWKRRLKTRDAADYIGCEPATLRAWRLRGRDDPDPGPEFIRLSPSLVVYDIEALDRFLAEKRVATASSAATPA